MLRRKYRVSETKEEHSHATVTTIKILDKTGQQIMGRPEGSYITIEALNWQ